MSMKWPPRAQVIWGVLGALAAAWFAVWMLFFPQYLKEYFAWDVVPRYAAAFIGAGYVFRTLFFLNVATESNWIRLRWIVWGNLAFTGTLLLATFWHIDQFNWPQFTPPTAHIWVVLYIFAVKTAWWAILILAFVLATLEMGVSNKLKERTNVNINTGGSDYDIN
jgi:hypothetical protein